MRIKLLITCLLTFSCLVAVAFCGGGRALADKSSREGRVAAKPLFRDPVYDGAADPVVIWNRRERRWFMLYTNRRANVPGLGGVAWVHATRIGLAESTD